MRDDCWTAITHKEIARYSNNLLWRFVKRNATESRAEEILFNLAGLRKADIVLLSNIRFSLSEETRLLVDEIAPRIVRRLAKESINERIIDRNRICGRIEWQQTFKSRATAGNDPSIFVCAKRSQLYDLPENRLFLYLLRHINADAKRFASTDEFEATKFSEESIRHKWVEKAASTAYQTARLLKNPYISKISGLHSISNKIIEAVSKNRQPLYRQLAEIALEYSCSVQHPLKYLKKNLRGNILEPLNWDTLYEIAVLLKILEAAVSEGWKEHSIGLIGGTGDTASILEKNGSQLKVYTQTLPGEMKKISAYKEVMKNFGLSEGLRRPDIILELSSNGSRCFLIVEVKRSQQRSYLADGAYKLLGYLKDFEKIANGGAASLSGFLVGWKGIAVRHFCDDADIHLTNWENLRTGFSDFLCLNEKGGRHSALNCQK